MEWLVMEGKSAEAKEEMEKADKMRNPYRFEADVLLTGLREWDRRMKVPENYLEWMPEEPPQPRKLMAVHVWPQLQNSTDVTSFLALCGFYQRFVADYATVATPLTNLMGKKAV